jgi:kynureninase
MKNINTAFDTSRNFALNMDREDPLREYREQFYFPKHHNGKDSIYLCGNSLGLQPKQARKYVEAVMNDWEKLAVKGHFEGEHPFTTYHESLSGPMSKIVGAKREEVVIMNTLTVNLHLMMLTFYRPTGKRHKILIEKNAFPSDQYAVKSQLEIHGFDPKEALLEMSPREGEDTLNTTDIVNFISEKGHEIALIMLGGINYYTGQAFDMKEITRAGQAEGCVVGFDLAHAAGNIRMDLHDWGVDFAAWCTYKYLNSGPGAIAGCFVHEKHFDRNDLLRLAGWWGHDKSSRFLMGDTFKPIRGAEGWQLSNGDVLSMASLKASLDIFAKAGMVEIVNKSNKLTAYLEYLVGELNNPKIELVTPEDDQARGAQLSIRVLDSNKSLFLKISDLGVVADWREPDVIRIAPAPLYNSFKDVFDFVELLKISLDNEG